MAGGTTKGGGFKNFSAMKLRGGAKFQRKNLGGGQNFSAHKFEGSPEYTLEYTLNCFSPAY